MPSPAAITSTGTQANRVAEQVTHRPPRHRNRRLAPAGRIEPGALHTGDRAVFVGDRGDQRGPSVACSSGLPAPHGTSSVDESAARCYRPQPRSRAHAGRSLPECRRSAPMANSRRAASGDTGRRRESAASAPTRPDRVKMSLAGGGIATGVPEAAGRRRLRGRARPRARRAAAV